MRYRIILYDKATEFMHEAIDVSPERAEAARRIAGLSPDEGGLGEYPLDERQTRELATLLGFAAEPEQFYYHLEPNEE